jgi:hypothetical protein
MEKIENLIKIENLENAKQYLVPHIFSENYYNILKSRLKGKPLTESQRYYYSHFIRKKLVAMAELLNIGTMANGKEFIRKDRFAEAIKLLKKYSAKHKRMKIFVSGSFLHSEKYNDIDIFILSQYDKQDYKNGRVHVNYLPENSENSLFFKSAYSVSVANFASGSNATKTPSIEEMLRLYETVVLLMLQKDNFQNELRSLVLMLEYASAGIVLNSMQLKHIVSRISRSKNQSGIISKYLVAKVINAYSPSALKYALSRFIEKNSHPESGRPVYENWKIYNKAYREAIEVAA